MVVPASYTCRILKFNVQILEDSVLGWRYYNDRELRKENLLLPDGLEQ